VRDVMRELRSLKRQVSTFWMIIALTYIYLLYYTLPPLYNNRKWWKLANSKREFPIEISACSKMKNTKIWWFAVLVTSLMSFLKEGFIRVWWHKYTDNQDVEKVSLQCSLRSEYYFCHLGHNEKHSLLFSIDWKGNELE